MLPQGKYNSLRDNWVSLAESIKTEYSLLGHLFQAKYLTLSQRQRIEKLLDPTRQVEAVLNLAVTEEKYLILCDCLEKDGQGAIVETYLKCINVNVENTLSDQHDSAEMPAGISLPYDAVKPVGRVLPLSNMNDSSISNAQSQYWHQTCNQLNVCKNEMVVINANSDNRVSQSSKGEKYGQLKNLKIPKPHLNEDIVRLIIYTEELEIEHEDDKEDMWNDIMNVEFVSQIHSVVSDDASEQDLRFVGELLLQNVRTVPQSTHVTFYLKLADTQLTEQFKQMYKDKKLDIIINKLAINEELIKKYNITKIMLKSEFLEVDYLRNSKFHIQKQLHFQNSIISKCKSCSMQLQMTPVPTQNTFANIPGILKQGTGYCWRCLLVTTVTPIVFIFRKNKQKLLFVGFLLLFVCILNHVLPFL